jgi:methionyl aminopeptidase
LTGMSLASRELECYRMAGKIASMVRRRIEESVHPGERIIRICEEAESMIRRNGGSPAFPLNVSVNQVAAHYTSFPGDETVLPEGGLVKIDLGVSVDGYIVDTATTIDLSRKETLMVEATEKALAVAISKIKAGVGISEIGKAISDVITHVGLKPISNLTGHGLKRYELHSGISVPNVPLRWQHVMSDGEVYAIEPFATKADGKGYVKETKSVFIYSCRGGANPKNNDNSEESNLLNELKKSFHTLPFSIRWLTHEISLKQLGKLVKRGSLIAYPVLVEAGNKLVAQSEHTLIVRKHDCEVLTL